MASQLTKFRGSQLITNDPILRKNELGFDTDKRVLKIGNGESKWSELQPAISLTLDESYTGNNLSGYNISKTTLNELVNSKYGEAASANENSTKQYTVALPKGTKLTVHLKNSYYNAKLNHCSALLNGVEKTYGTDIIYTYTLNSNADANFKWRVEGILGGQTALTCDSWWDCYLTMQEN